MTDDLRDRAARLVGDLGSLADDWRDVTSRAASPVEPGAAADGAAHLNAVLAAARLLLDQLRPSPDHDDTHHE